jgi:Transglutaminase-like superfamily
MSAMADETGPVHLDDYRTPGILTDLTAEQREIVARVGGGPVALCRAAQSVLMLPELALAAGVDPSRASEKNARPTAEILGIALHRCDAPLGPPRPMDRRVLGTCRHFAVLACALLRAHAIPARARCGFETYFRPGWHNDHWITEYWDDSRWVRIDSEILGLDLVERPDDLAVGQFLTGSEAWAAYRRGADPMTFGVHGTENWGGAEIVGNAIRDLAALNKIEMLPWDEWGPMRACYDNGVAPEIEAFMDDLVDAASTEDPARLLRLYNGMPVPEGMIIAQP